MEKCHFETYLLNIPQMFLCEASDSPLWETKLLVLLIAKLLLHYSAYLSTTQCTATNSSWVIIVKDLGLWE